jgi:transcriptional regulator with XRE-family HTH domain
MTKQPKNQAADDPIVAGLLRLRDWSGKSQRRLSTDAGLGPAFMSNVINGRSSPSVDNLKALCQDGGSSVAEFFEGLVILPFWLAWRLLVFIIVLSFRVVMLAFTGD